MQLKKILKGVGMNLTRSKILIIIMIIYLLAELLAGVIEKLF